MPHCAQLKHCNLNLCALNPECVNYRATQSHYSSPQFERNNPPREHASVSKATGDALD